MLNEGAVVTVVDAAGRGSPLPGAICSASTTSSVRMWSAMAQSTTRREWVDHGEKEPALAGAVLGDVGALRADVGRPAAPVVIARGDTPSTRQATATGMPSAASYGSAGRLCGKTFSRAK